ncbi:unnamed protein product [Tilletia controversa]|nr:unnamed protein product [Tilletia controversa]CAD6938489.1 unnamed protein product [Tilletia controversa]CAD6955757.1 unnamed protein product [Tilletia controversa]
MPPKSEASTSKASKGKGAITGKASIRSTAKTIIKRKLPGSLDTATSEAAKTEPLAKGKTARTKAMNKINIKEDKDKDDDDDDGDDEEEQQMSVEAHENGKQVDADEDVCLTFGIIVMSGPYEISGRVVKAGLQRILSIQKHFTYNTFKKRIENIVQEDLSNPFGGSVTVTVLIPGTKGVFANETQLDGEELGKHIPLPFKQRLEWVRAIRNKSKDVSLTSPPTWFPFPPSSLAPTQHSDDKKQASGSKAGLQKRHSSPGVIEVISLISDSEDEVAKKELPAASHNKNEKTKDQPRDHVDQNNVESGAGQGSSTNLYGSWMTLDDWGVKYNVSQSILSVLKGDGFPDPCAVARWVANPNTDLSKEGFSKKGDRYSLEAALDRWRRDVSDSAHVGTPRQTQQSAELASGHHDHQAAAILTSLSSATTGGGPSTI